MQRTQGTPAAAMVGNYNYPPAYPVMAQNDPTPQAQMSQSSADAQHTMTMANDPNYAAVYASYGAPPGQQAYGDYMQQYYQPAAVGVAGGQAMPPNVGDGQNPSAYGAGQQIPVSAAQYYQAMSQEAKQPPPPVANYPGSMPNPYGAYPAPGGGQVAPADPYSQYYSGQYATMPPSMPSVRQMAPGMMGDGSSGRGGDSMRGPPARRSRWDTSAGGPGDGMPPISSGRDRSYPPSIGPGKRDDQYHMKDDGRDGGAKAETTDSNNAVFIQGIPDMADNQIVAEYFSQVGDIMADNRGGPRVHVYKDKISGRPKGEAVVSFMSSQIAAAAIERFHGQYFPGCEVPMKVTFATTRVSDPPRDGYRRGGGGPPGGRYDNGGGRGDFRGGFGGGGGRGGGGYGGTPPSRGRPMGGGSFRGTRGTGANMEMRTNDWICNQCNNTNFGFRTHCNKCRANKSDSVGGSGGDFNSYGGGGGRGGDASRGGFKSHDYGDWSRGGGGPARFSRGGPPRGGRGDYGGGSMRSGGPSRDRPRPY